MRIRNRILRPFFIAFLLVSMASLWAIFAPEPFGGQASYVMIAGASMEPGMHAGDLAIVREVRVYQVGDVVTYRHPVAGPIIHRIIDRVGDRYIFKGDNNDWVDSYRPRQDEFIGKLWIHLPNMAQVLQKVRSPLWRTFLSLLIAVGIFSSFAREKEKERPGSRLKRKDPQKHAPSPFRGGIEGILFVLAALALATGILALASFSRPETVMDDREIPYQMLGEFQYAAQAPPGIYDGEEILSGDPVYLELTDQFEVYFQFQLSSETFSQVDGMIRLDAMLSDPGGWNRLIELHPSVMFRGEAPRMDGTINLAALGSMVESLEERTGFERPYYTLEIIPGVIMKGKCNGREILDTFEPRLTFRMEEFQLYLIATEPNTPRLAQLHPEQTGYLQHAVEVESTIPILGMDLPVRTGRWISGIGLGLAFLGFIGIGIFYTHASREGEAAQITVKYGSMLVEVQEGDFANGHHRVEVNAFEDLGRFAERVGGVILHEKRENHHHYYVHEGDVTYHYQAVARELESMPPSNEPEEAMASSDGGDIGPESPDEGKPAIPDVVGDDGSEGKEDRGWQGIAAKCMQKARAFFHSIRRRPVGGSRGEGGESDGDA
jgi:signal peptidase I